MSVNDNDVAKVFTLVDVVKESGGVGGMLALLEEGTERNKSSTRVGDEDKNYK